MLDPFKAHTGVKQGCPLSPLLFGLFIEELEDYVLQRHPSMGPLINSGSAKRAPLFMFADDTAVIGLAPHELQILLDTINEWCTSHDMTINVGKT
jgi:Reverse transcriptase (RNA-dependent DNA polymerase)